ncbi:MAG: hypothetical protein D6688_02095 [Alphaproteobacteria bacterium]|nr:MAG: hypothetical protein D6688_02095 [Alphaproteobacteria bacterium]
MARPDPRQAPRHSRPADRPKAARRPAVVALLAGAVAALHVPGDAGAEEIRLHDVEAGVVLPMDTTEFRLGSRQAGTGSLAGTGLQVYEGAVARRGQGPWQLGARFSVYDDPPPRPVGGSLANMSIIAVGVDAKREIGRSGNLSWAVAGSIEGLRYSTAATGTVPAGANSDFLVGSVHLPASVRFSPALTAYFDPYIAFLPQDFPAGPGFGTNGFLGAGAAWRAAPVLSFYAEAHVPVAGRGNTLNAAGAVTRATAWTVGARLRVAPAADLDIHASNRVAGTLATSGLVLPPGGDKAMVGVTLVYRPGQGRDTAGPRLVGSGPRPLQGLMLRSGAILPQGTRRIAFAAGTRGTGSASLALVPDPGLQFDAILEKHATAAPGGGVVAPEIDTRYMLGGRLQLAAGGARPVWLAAGILAGRDIRKPTVGVIYAETTASVSLSRRLSATVQAHGAAWGGADVLGLGMGLGAAVTDALSLHAEASVNGDVADTWALGLRWRGGQGLAATAAVTNAIGLHGHGTLLAGTGPRVVLGFEKSL